MRRFHSMQIKCFILALIMVLVGASTVFAAPYESEDDHIHSEKYVCKHNYHGEDYDCTKKIPQNKMYNPNSEKPMSAEELKNIEAEFAGITSDEELKNFISKYYGIPVEDIDLDMIRNADVAPMSDEEFQKYLAEAVDAGLVLPSRDNSDNIFFETSEDISAQQPLGLVCDHEYLAGPCTGNHYGQNGCNVFCIRRAGCMYTPCTSSTTVVISETNHS